MIVAHGNSIRALIKYIDKISNQNIVELNIPTGVPLVYNLDGKLKPQNHYYLGDIDEINKKTSVIDTIMNFNILFIIAMTSTIQSIFGNPFM